MDQITVCDIPLPGEELKHSLPNNVEVISESVENTMASMYTTIEEVEKSEPIEIGNEADSLTQKLFEEVETTTSEVITETVQELQMEVEAASADCINALEADVSTVVLDTTDDSNKSLMFVEDEEEEVVEESVDDKLEVNDVEGVQDVEDVKDVENVEEVEDVETVEDVEQVEDVEEVKEEIGPIVEEPQTVQQEAKPAKKTSRTNSTIEAIKNDWLTIEEVSEEIEASSPKTEPIVTEPETVTVPDINDTENSLEIVEEEEEPETKSASAQETEDCVVVETKPAQETEDCVVVETKPGQETKECVVVETKPGQETKECVVVETKPGQETKECVVVEAKPGQETKECVVMEMKPEQGTEDCVVMETVHDEIIGHVAENVTIEIIDNSSVVEEKLVKEDVEVVEKKPVVVKRSRGRPPKSSVTRSDNLQIPCHVLGRNVDNPTEDLISNGRTPPKPRLGVKVPYRFLTSQIVTKEEIANELIEITDKRNPTPDPPAGGDIFFASKLTQRLANKIALNSKKKDDVNTAPKTTTEVVVVVEESTSGIPNDALTSTTSAISTTQMNKKSIGDNSDLLAILEGDVDVNWANELRNNKPNEVDVKPVLVAKTPEVEATPRKLSPETERQLALKQLREMPKIEGRGRPRKHFYDMRPQRVVKTEQPAASTPKKEKAIAVSNETNENIKQAVNKLASKIKENVSENTETQEDEESDLNLLARRVTKTYSRKETVVDIPDDLEFIVNEAETSSALTDEQVDEKPKNVDENPKSVEKPKKVEEKFRKTKRSIQEVNKPEIMLVSKRARIIKKKVIWDPAEVPKTRVLNAIRRAQMLEIKARKQKMQEQTTDEDETDEEETEDERKQKQNKHDVKLKIKRPLRKVIQRGQLSKIKKKMLISRPLRFVRSTNGELKSSLALSKKKKQMMSEIAKSVRNKPKKTELDKLLGDEGAVNLLYSVKQRGRGRPPKNKKSLTQLELQNRTKALRETITQISNQEDTTKALRKKETPQLTPLQLPTRKKSRDSVRSSLQSPPPSPSFFHPQRAEASRIIRRHSSSFSSECSSPRRLSVEDFQSPARVLRRKDTKINEKKTEKLTTAEKRKLNVEMSKNFDKTPKKRTRSSKGEDENETKPELETKGQFAAVQTDYKELLLRKRNNFYQIVMNTPANSKLRNVLSLQMFQELTALITKLSKDENCKMLCLTSNGKSFCNGLDFSHLIQSTSEKRSSAALDMSQALKEFILSLAKFTKPLFCCISSSSSFLGVTMLPYFDVVLAAETATLSADYSRLGQSSEGAPQLTLTRKVANDLFLLGKKFSAKEAVDLGLVTIVDTEEKLEERLLKVGEEFEIKSQQSLAATKTLLRQPLLQKLEEALDFEQKLLVELWPTVECQQRFKKLLTEQELW